MTNQNNTLKLLADIGFMAVSSNMSKHAFSIFYGLEKNMPNHPLPHLGYAFQYINKKLYQDALDILLKKALPLNENEPSTLAFIGMVLMFEGRNKESEQYFNQVISSQDESAKSMAQEFLNKIKTQ